MSTERFFDGREMFMVHDMFRREFGLMPSVVRGVRAGDRDRTRIVAAHITALTTVLHTHHHGEDVHVWPALLQRGSADVTRVIDLMENQHARIEELAAEVDAALEAWWGGATAECRDALADLLDRLILLIKDHMRLEEERAVPLMEKYITAAEWTTMLQVETGEMDPEALTLGFGMAMYEGDPDIVGAVISTMPAEVQPVIQAIATQAYAAHAELIYGTPTPPRSTEL
ncbi:MAG TPA: hemerythrin domain-containing protein [Actinoallomurus sp.]